LATDPQQPPPVQPAAAQPEPAEEPDQPDIPRDWRAVIVAGLGIGAIVLVVVIGLAYLPGPIASGKTDNASAAIGGAIGAAVAAIGTVVSAYFGIKAANLAREAAQETTERAQKSNERTQVALTEVAASADSAAVQRGLDRSVEKLRELNLV
jgi:hypothetical protein